MNSRSFPITCTDRSACVFRACNCLFSLYQKRVGEELRERRVKMATYILLSNLTDEGAETIKKNPARIKEVNKEIEGMGSQSRTNTPR